MKLPLALLLLFVTLVAPHAARGDDPQPLDRSVGKRDEKDPILWYDAKLLGIEGQGWQETKAPYDRLPGKAEGKVRKEVWNLSRDSSGIAVRFATASPSIRVRWNVTSDRLAMPHMAATAVSGVDLYVRSDNGTWRWLACGKPTKTNNSEELIANLAPAPREYLLYLPLYNAVSSLEIGVPEGAAIAPPSPRPADKQKPLVFYGTSITHGACASRPGMTHTAILGRRFDRPVINLGFSGNGRMETEVAELLAELDPAVFIIDCLPNILADEVLGRTKKCVAILREKHPTTPIVLVEDRSYGDSHLVASKRERNLTSRAALRKMFDELKSAGDDHLYYIEGEHLLGDDFEGTVDSSHPNDLGFMRQADAFAVVLGPILGAAK